MLKKFNKVREIDDEVPSLNWVDVGLSVSYLLMATPGCATM
jgi:hypothetical protein